jgi:ABC-type polysaccharide/polyol phosphate transport system ATPase subunit
MVASVSLRDVYVEFPIYHGGSRSLKKNLIWRGTGGTVANDANKRTYVKALNGLTFDLRDGDRVGLVGHNGAGKTTLLRTLAGVYEPTRGRIRVEGEVCPLFEIGLGMEYEATGYENIMLRGLYLGLSRREIRERMDSIAEFTELGAFLDMPLRTYSAGMMLRLSFAVSTSIRSDVLLIDEGILAGDRHFLEKAQQRLGSFVEQSSIMVLATHRSAFLRNWCNLGIYMRAGSMVRMGPIDEILREYEEDGASQPAVGAARK